MRILFVSANPDWTPRLDLGDEMRTLMKSLHGHDVRLMLLPAAQPEDLKVAIEGNNIDVVHFSGHATSEEGLLFRNKNGMKEAMSPAALRDMLDGKGVKLAILNACQTLTTAEGINETVGAIIATTEELDDRAAQVLTKVFYTRLGDGASVEAAFDSALESINTAELDNVYVKSGSGFEQTLFPPTVDYEGELTVEGQGDWDKYFYVSYIDEQIASLKKDLDTNRIVFGVLLAFGIAFIPWLWIQANVEWRDLFPLLKENWGFLVNQPFLDWLVGVGAGIPALYALMHRRLAVQSNEQLNSLEQLKRMVRESDDMSPDLRARLHKILEMSLRGADTNAG